MYRKWNLLQLGVRIRIKGENDMEGKIIQYFTDDSEIKGYIVELGKGEYTIVALDDKIEALGI